MQEFNNFLIENSLHTVILSTRIFWLAFEIVVLSNTILWAHSQFFQYVLPAAQPLLRHYKMNPNLSSSHKDVL